MKPINSCMVKFSLDNKYVISIILEDGRINAAVEGNEGKTDENGIMFASLITESIKAMQKGLSLNRYFNPNIITTVEQSDEDEKGMYVKLRWLKSGKLRIVGFVDKKYQHIEKPEDAIGRTRTFTCDIEILSLIPTSKNVN